MSKDKRKHEQKFLDRYQEYCERLRIAAATNTDKLYRYNEVDASNAHLVPKTELQENFYGFTKWLRKNHSGKIVYVALESDGSYAVHWKGETKDPVEGPSSFDGVPVRYLRVKEGEIIL